MRLSAARVEALFRIRSAMWGVATKCTIPSNKSSNPLPLSNRTRVGVVISSTFYFFTFLRAVHRNGRPSIFGKGSVDVRDERRNEACVFCVLPPGPAARRGEQ